MCALDDGPLLRPSLLLDLTLAWAGQVLFCGIVLGWSPAPSGGDPKWRIGGSPGAPRLHPVPTGLLPASEWRVEMSAVETFRNDENTAAFWILVLGDALIAAMLFIVTLVLFPPLVGWR